MPASAITGRPEQIQFRNSELAAANLKIVQFVIGAEQAASLRNLLFGVPDADQALNLLERLTSVHAEALNRALRRNPVVLHYVVALLGHSFWLGEGLIRDPDLLAAMAKRKYLDRIQSSEDYEQSFGRYRSRSRETDVSVLLARFKRREYVRILLRDVLGVATVAEVTAEISALSDVLIENAVKAAQGAMRDRYGVPQRFGQDGRLEDVPFSVVGLGKLGGNELNYSSDIDLLYLYGDGDEPEWASISNREYFVRMAQLVSGFLSQVTADGPVFRIDLRLRPQGREGEPAVSLDASLHYYAYIAQDWELQALIKARHCAGDVALARALIRGVQRFVYRGERGEINFSAIKTALASRERTGASRRHFLARRSQSVQVPPSGIDVKLDRGGIRDIEFLVQCLQRVYGGDEPWLRTAGTLFSLQKLHDKQHISGREFHDLTAAYTFLRIVEHRLQIQRGQQIHRLPSSDGDLEVLAKAVLGPDATGARAFVDIVNARMQAVAEIYSRIVYQQQFAERLRSPDGSSGTEAASENRPGLPARFLPPSSLAEQGAPAVGEGRRRRNLDRLLDRLRLRSRDQSLAISEELLQEVLPALSVSEYLVAALARTPRFLSSLESSIQDQETRAGLPLNDLPGIKSHHAERKFQIAAETVLRPGPARHFLQRLTQCADEAITAVMDQLQSEGVAALALGRLGTREFGLLSDVDLLFVRGENTEAVLAGKMVEQTIGALGAYTREGAMFEVDLRLRPRGREGELVCTPSEILSYFEREAQPWEILTYTKLRFVAGDPETAQRLCGLIGNTLRQRSSQSSFVSAIRVMRARLESTHIHNSASKRRAGGFYDIDFATALLMLKSSLPFEGTTLERLNRLHAEGLLNEERYTILGAGAIFYRTLSHAIEVITGTIQLPSNEEVVMDISSLMPQLLGCGSKWDLQETMRMHLHQVRLAFEQIVA